MEASSPPAQESREGESKRRLPPLSIPDGGTSLEDIEHALVEMALRQSHGNQIKAAKLLDSRDALRYKMKKFGLAHGEEEQPASYTSLTVRSLKLKLENRN
jgi:DNA-binding NtrC family response regulator